MSDSTLCQGAHGDKGGPRSPERDTGSAPVTPPRVCLRDTRGETACGASCEAPGHTHTTRVASWHTRTTAHTHAPHTLTHPPLETTVDKQITREARAVSVDVRRTGREQHTF